VGPTGLPGVAPPFVQPVFARPFVQPVLGPA
jgi:hypothetical protein